MRRAGLMREGERRVCRFHGPSFDVKVEGWLVSGGRNFSGFVGNWVQHAVPLQQERGRLWRCPDAISGAPGPPLARRLVQAQDEPSRDSALQATGLRHGCGRFGVGLGLWSRRTVGAAAAHLHQESGRARRCPDAISGAPGPPLARGFVQVQDEPSRDSALQATGLRHGCGRFGVGLGLWPRRKRGAARCAPTAGKRAGAEVSRCHQRNSGTTSCATACSSPG